MISERLLPASFSRIQTFFFRGPSQSGTVSVIVPASEGVAAAVEMDPQAASPTPADALPESAASFDFTSLLRLRSFVYLLLGTFFFLFQINSTIAIKSLALQNERLRTHIQLTSSVLAAQELKIRELQSIHSITKDAAALGLTPSVEPPVEIEP
ncbi:hypothetical protein [Pelodictyon luteolum]|uniref:Uncharacterized protein n=1 Tax=Chlorobium luteolum (strain DSM 273 / BCRC 81028 / 2530) TaxID=319225 RepID=Q3B122_CHLL3|nr:hypothetical protein [Pelodictyon luteolum]ABB24959.1 hypothetical protein Plut_2117 [Pelodictyon luteolum DSM 273]